MLVPAESAARPDRPRAGSRAPTGPETIQAARPATTVGGCGWTPRPCERADAVAGRTPPGPGLGREPDRYDRQPLCTAPSSARAVATVVGPSRARSAVRLRPAARDAKRSCP